MAGKPQSWKRIRDERRKENFIGRGEPIRIFTENLVADSPDYMIISVTGEGGAGKSTLLARLASIGTSAEYNARVITCDDRQLSPILAMGYIGQKLAEQGLTEKEFDERYKKYGELRQELESDPKVPRGGLDLLAMGVTDFTIKSLRRAPGVGVFLEYVDEKAAGAALAEVVQHGIAKWGNKDEVKLLRDPEQVLTPLFLKLIRKAYDDHKLVLMFDVFERTSESLAPWLRKLFNFEYGDFDTRVMFVLSGREALEQYWTELADLIGHISLEPFTLEELRLYLSNHEITDNELVQQIYEDTNGLPVLAELLAAAKPTLGIPLPDVSKDAVERFLQWTPNEEQRQAALSAAVPRQFNKDILSAALGEDSTQLHNWLTSQSYIRTTDERGWFYHEKVRDLMLRHLKNLSPGILAMIHQRLANFFDSENTKLGLTEANAYRNDTWRRMECERLYHATSGQANPSVDLVNAFLHAFRWSSRSGIQIQIAGIARQIGYETGSHRLKETSVKMVDLYDAYQQENHEIVIELLNFFLKTDGLTATAKSALHCHRGWANIFRNNYENALQDLTIAIQLDPHYAFPFGARGLTYRLVQNYEKAISDLSSAIELDPQYLRAWGQRGFTYRLMEKYEEALQDFSAALELDPKSAWALGHRGLIYRLMGRSEEALHDFSSAIELNPKDAWALGQRGITYRLMEKYEEALQDFSSAIELSPKEAWIFTHRGRTYRLMGKHDEAMRDFSSSIELNPKFAWALEERGEIHLLLENYEEAIQDFHRAIEADPNRSWPYYQRALIYRARNDMEAAQRDLESARKLANQFYEKSPKDWRNTFILALYELALSKGTRSMQLYRSLLKENLPPGLKNENKDYLEQFIRLFPTNEQAKEIRILFG